MIKINIDEDGEFSGEHKVMQVPTIIAFKNGKEVDRFTGFKSEEDLNKFINLHKK
ncbi:MAG: thioredoxin family protein [Mycoplasmataceae bacterium]|nr:thioredoxin family protein [Mycoplasmataceae bacterium]